MTHDKTGLHGDWQPYCRFVGTESRNHIEDFAPSFIKSRQGVRKGALVTRALVSTLATRVAHVGSNELADLRQAFLPKIC